MKKYVMTVKKVRKIAKDIGAKVKKNMKKTDIIYAIQKAEGNFQCFDTAKGFCDQADCAWKKDCYG